MASGFAGTTRGQLVRWLAALAIGAAAGYVCTLLHTPIPWMLGPLFAIAALRVSGVDLEVPVTARYVGQWIIGTALGLYFTPAVMRHVGTLCICRSSAQRWRSSRGTPRPPCSRVSAAST